MANKNLNTILSSVIINQQIIATKLISGNYKTFGNISGTNFILENGKSLQSAVQKDTDNVILNGTTAYNNLSTGFSTIATIEDVNTKISNKIINTSLSSDTPRAVAIQTIEKNTDYYFGFITSLTVNNIEDSYLETNLYFKTGDQILTPTINFPSDTKYIGEIEFQSNSEYIINISNKTIIIGKITSNI